MRLAHPTAPSTAAGPLPGPPAARKLECLFVMEAQYLPFLYGPDEQAALGRLGNFGHPCATAADMLADDGKFADVEAVFASWGMPPLHADMLRRLPRLRVVFHAAGTIRTFVTAEVWQRGIRITSAALANAKPVAEFTVAAIVFSLKRVWERVHSLREKKLYRRHSPAIPGCYGTTVGLLALGKIGRRVAEHLRQMEVRVIAYDPYVTPAEAEALGVQLCSIEEVFASANVVSCHLPLYEATAQLVDGKLLRRMKPDSTFINTARGAVVNEPDLVAVLQERPDLYAVLDTIVEEPPSAGNPLLLLPNAIVTPHLAGSMCLECRRMGRMMSDEFRRYVAGEPLLGEINEQDLAILA